MNTESKVIPNAYPLIVYEDFRKCVQGFNYYLGLCVGSLELFVYTKPENMGKLKNYIFKMPNNEGIWQSSMEAFKYSFEKTPKPNLQLSLFFLSFNWDKFINLTGNLFLLHLIFIRKLQFILICKTFIKVDFPNK